MEHTSPASDKETLSYHHDHHGENNSPIALGVELEGKWGSNLERHSTSESSSIHDPEKVKTHGNDVDGSRNQDLEGTPVRRVVTAQDWTGPDDPENPHNWPIWKRVWHTVPPALFAFIVTFGSSVYTPAYTEVAAHFGVSNTAALLGVSLYVAGLGFGPILAAPISETFGRRIVYRISLPISMLFTLGAGFSQSFGSFLVCRFFAGFTGSPVLAVGAGTNADLFPPKQRAAATSCFLLAPFLGPSLGPVVGGFAAQYKGWRWTQWCILFIALFIVIISMPMEETYKKIILKNRAKRLGIEPPKQVGPSGFGAIKFLITVTLFRPMHMLLFEPIVGLLSLYNAFAFSILFAFFEAFPIVFVGVYHFNTWQTGVAFIAVGLGVLIGVITAIAIDRVLYQKEYQRVINAGGTTVAPEHRLWAAMFGSFGIPVGLFIFAWTSRSSVHWIVPILASIPFAWGNVSIFISAALYLVDTYGALNGASALAANGLLRYGMSAAFPLFTVQMYNKMGIGWASSFLGFVSLAMLPIPWVLFKWGPKIRSKSHYDTIKA